MFNEKITRGKKSSTLSTKSGDFELVYQKEIKRGDISWVRENKNSTLVLLVNSKRFSVCVLGEDDKLRKILSCLYYVSTNFDKTKNFRNPSVIFTLVRLD